MDVTHAKNFFKQLHSQFNKSFFGSKLPSLDFKINLNRGCIFEYIQPKFDLPFFEVGRTFVSANKVQILDDMLHAMVHQSNNQNGIDDRSRNQYHRAGFRDLALEKGLVVVCSPSRGWGHTYSDQISLKRVAHNECKLPTDKDAKKLVQIYQGLTLLDLKVHQGEIRTELSDTTTKQFQYKYTCSCMPPYIIRIGRRPGTPDSLNASCNKCGKKFAAQKRKKETLV